VYPDCVYQSPLHSNHSFSPNHIITPILPVLGFPSHSHSTVPIDSLSSRISLTSIALALFSVCTLQERLFYHCSFFWLILLVFTPHIWTSLFYFVHSTLFRPSSLSLASVSCAVTETSLVWLYFLMIRRDKG
jgi:hypothetical protein